jgi:hypothetical protein
MAVGRGAQFDGLPGVMAYVFLHSKMIFVAFRANVFDIS